MWDGLLDFSVLGYIVATLLMTHVTIASVTIFLHRHQAHRALELHPLVSHFFRFWLWLTTGMVTKQWVAVHRKHHAMCETEEDPHSPQIYGIRKVLWEGAELYRAEAAKPETLEKYGRGTPDDWLERNVYSRFTWLGVTLMLLIDLALFGIAGVSIWAVQMLWIPFWAAGVINGIGHWWGYRNFETADASTNIVPWGIVIGGEEMHNNHHAYPSSAKFSNKGWEFDIGWWYIRLLAFLGLARVRRVAPKPVLVPGKSRVDMDTVRAIIANRFQVMADYGRKVVVPVLREEYRKADGSCHALYRRARRVLLRDEARLDEAARDRLKAVLDSSQALRTVYQYQRRLRELWNRTANSPDNLLQALQEWCRQAEATGIKALQDFAQSLRSYALQSPRV